MFVDVCKGEKKDIFFIFVIMNCVDYFKNMLVKFVYRSADSIARFSVKATHFTFSRVNITHAFISDSIVRFRFDSINVSIFFLKVLFIFMVSVEDQLL